MFKACPDPAWSVVHSHPRHDSICVVVTSTLVKIYTDTLCSYSCGLKQWIQHKLHTAHTHIRLLILLGFAALEKCELLRKGPICSLTKPVQLF